MPHLLLIRHAKSSWSDSTLVDHERPLNGRGERAAPLMGRRLADVMPAVDLFAVSTAVRARQTLAGLLSTTTLRDRQRVVFSSDLYDADDDDLVEYCRAVDPELACLCLIGHNPGLTDLTERLASADAPDKIATAGAVWLQWDGDWRDCGSNPAILDWYRYPKQRT